MQLPSREEKIAQWLAEGDAAHARLAAPGTMSLADVGAMTPGEFFAGIGSGELPCPPFGELIDFVPLEWSEGRFLFQGTPAAKHYNPLGTVHGGYAATLLDSCMGCAIHTQLKKGQAYTTLDLRVSFVRAMGTHTGPVRAEGKVIHLGRSTALAEGRLYDVEGKLYATGTTTCMIFDMTR